MTTAIAPPRKRNLTSWLFVLPSLIVVLTVTIFPTIYSLWLSLHKWEATLKAHPFIGLGNYIALFQADRFWHALWLTTMLTFFGVGLELVLGFAFAQFVLGGARGHRLVVGMMLLPVMVMPVVVGYTWRLLWDPQFGPINQVIGWLLGRPFHFVWLGQPASALFAMIVTDVWQWTPFMFLIFYAGLSGLDLELFDAAEIDGASAWQQLWGLTIPLMRPIIIVAVLIRALDAIKAFDVVFTMTKGGPGTSTETLAYYIYKEGYTFFRLGYGAAASIVVLIMLSVLLTILLRFLRKAFA